MRLVVAMVLLATACRRPAPTLPDSSAAALRAELNRTSRPVLSDSAAQAARDSAARARIEAAKVDRATWAAIDTSRLWYERRRAVDLTGEGRVDTLVLRARGPQPDSLVITLSAIVDERVTVIEQWYSDYELVDPPFPRDTTPEVVAHYLRASLDTTLARFKVELSMVDPRDYDQYDTACASDPTPCIRSELGADSALAEAVWKDFQAGPRPLVRYSYGYESVITEAWSPVARRFIYVWGCC